MHLHLSFLVYLLFGLFKCDAGMATDSMFAALYRKPTKVMLWGPGCSVGAANTAEVSHRWNLTQVSVVIHIVLDGSLTLSVLYHVTSYSINASSMILCIFSVLIRLT